MSGSMDKGNTSSETYSGCESSSQLSGCMGKSTTSSGTFSDTENSSRSSDHKGKSKSTTRNMKFFPLSDPDIRGFMSHLESMDGGCKSSSVASIMAKDISKFLYYCDPSKVDWLSLINRPKVLTYFEYLKDNCKVGPEDRLTKLERHCDALHYLKVMQDDPEVRKSVDSFLDISTKWKCTLRKQKKTLNHKRLEQLSETSSLDVSLIRDFQSNEKMWDEFDDILTSIITSKSTTHRKLKFAMTALLLSVLFGSWQRPGAVINLKLHQFQNAVKIDEVYVASVLEHKTGIGGAARLMFDERLHNRMMQYLKYVRPCIDDKECDNIFLMPDGAKVKSVNNLIRFMQNELHIDIPTATKVRKIGATAVARQCTESEARIVAK